MESSRTREVEVISITIAGGTPDARRALADRLEQQATWLAKVGDLTVDVTRTELT